MRKIWTAIILPGSFVLLMSLATHSFAAVITFPDPGLESAVRAAIGKPTGDILDSDVDGSHLVTLDALGHNITNLSGLEYCTGLTFLSIGNNAITNLGPVSSLKQLQNLQASGNQISDLSPLSGLSALNSLSLNVNQISDIAALSSLTGLKTLYLNNNQIASLAPLASLTSLETLEVGNNLISNLAPISDLTALKQLQISINQISDITAIKDLTALQILCLSDNTVSNIQALSGLTALAHLDLRRLQISDIGPLAGLTQLSVLYLDSNPLETLQPLSGLTALTRLYLSLTGVSDLGALTTLPNIQYLELVSNQVVDLAPLAANTGLATNDQVVLSNNPLSQVALCEQIPDLQGRWVQVIYDGQCGDTSNCQLFPILEEQGKILAATQGPALGLPEYYMDWDLERWPALSYGDGIPDLWQLRLLADAYCNVNHRLHDIVVSAYEANMAALALEKPELAFAWTAMTLSVSAALRDSMSSLLGLNPENYQVCQEPGKTTLEPFSGTGDCDHDNLDNREEYEYVVSNGGTIDGYALAAAENNPFWTGNPELPASGGFGMFFLIVTFIASACMLTSRKTRYHILPRN